ncbi:hypothetical protein ACIQMY_17480 [Streptomyces sp. NPDC091368]|uniref:hypothetical protein n=1 Tax=Streptomyces sp. NPDC091368 TaxID=3365993 RepID=UPI003829CF0B
MYEGKEPEQAPVHTPPDAGRVLDWLADRGAVEDVLQDALGELPDERDLTLSRMGSVLQAMAQGLSPAAAAVWAGIPEATLLTWIDEDPAFAAALHASRALAVAHGVRTGQQYTPAMIRVLLVALSTGDTTVDAAKLAGFRPHRFSTLLQASSRLQALVAAARKARTASRGSSSVPGGYRSRQPGRKPAVPRGFRLVRRSAPSNPQPPE